MRSLSSPLLHIFSGHTFVDLENALRHALLGNRLGYGERYGFLASVVFSCYFWGGLGRVWIESHCFLVNLGSSKMYYELDRTSSLVTS